MLPLSFLIREKKAVNQRISNKLALLAVVLALGALTYSFEKTGPNAARQETALERINRTGTLRCGYVVWPPYLAIDPQTKEKSGAAYDYAMALGREMGIKIEWAEEVGWGSYQAGLNANRFDVMCSPVWASGPRARSSLLTRPVFGTPLYAVARTDDSRFDKDMESINASNVKIAVLDGDATQTIRQMRFPSAQELSLSPMTDNAQMILNVTGRKADVALFDIFSFIQINNATDGKIKLVGGRKPVREFSNVLAVKTGEADLKAALDASICVLVKSGVTDQIVKKYSGLTPPAE